MGLYVRQDWHIQQDRNSSEETRSWAGNARPVRLSPRASERVRMRVKNKWGEGGEARKASQLSKQFVRARNNEEGGREGALGSSRKETLKKKVVKLKEDSGRTEIEPPVFTHELQGVHQLSPAQRLRRGHLHHGERQRQRQEQSATARGHLLDLRGSWGGGEQNKQKTMER